MTELANPPHGPASLTPHGSVHKELSIVTLKTAVLHQGRWIEAGASGTVVAIYKGGRGYEIEFEAPFWAVVTVEADAIQD